MALSNLNIQIYAPKPNLFIVSPLSVYGNSFFSRSNQNLGVIYDP